MDAATARRHPGRIAALVFNVILIGAAAWVFFNRQMVLDEVALINYTPSADVQALASADTMTALSQRYFYASHPTIDDRPDFNSHCTNHDERSIILGCYYLRQIHVFNVTDSRLPRVKEVTAAHEMLHAAYERLSDSERAHVNRLVEDQLARIDDPRIKDLIATYNRTEPGEVDNEMHSILGTEVSPLSNELEDYYRQYFVSRGAIVDFSHQYESVFADLKAQQATLSDELNHLASTINQRTASLNQAAAQLNADIRAFNAKAQSGGFTTQADFDSQRSALESRQKSLQAERDQIQAMIDDYNAKVQQLNALNLEAQSLNGSINSNLAPVPSL